MKQLLQVAFYLLVFFSAGVQAQSIRFDFDDTIPVVINGTTLSNPWAGGINFPLFSEIDLNGDGIHDLFCFDIDNLRISTFINDGSAGTSAWHYAPEYISKFPPLLEWALLYDYNCDGKADLFTLSPSRSGISVYRNDFDSINGLHFTLIVSMLMEHYFSSYFNVYATAVQLPTFGDVDGDGDMDILGLGSFQNGRVSYHRNYSEEHGHGCDSLEYNLETETWGNFIGPFNTGYCWAKAYCFHCRHAHQDDFLLENYDQSRAAQRDDTFWNIFMIDIDGDNDKDMLIGDGCAPNSLLVVNGGTTDSAIMVSQDTLFPNYDVPATNCDFHNHAYIDVDNDGVKDLLVSVFSHENKHGVWYYKNTGTTAAPVFDYQSSSFLVDQMIDVGEGAGPVLFDADNDGPNDLVISNFGVFDCPSGTYPNSLYLFKNTGTATNPAFQLVDSDFAGISSLLRIGPVYPAFGDLDNDGDKDLIVGSYDGRLVYLNNNSGTFFLAASYYMSIDVGNSSTPQLMDLNRDGLLDLVIGEKNGFINYYQNVGTVTSPFFTSTPTIDTLGGINLQTTGYVDGFTVPYFFDDHGTYKLIVSCMKGDVYLYDNIDGNLNGQFNLIDTIIHETEGVRFDYNLAVSGGDLNNDSLVDLLVGIHSGGMKIYLQHNSLVGIHNPETENGTLSVVPNPSHDECWIHCYHAGSGRHQVDLVNYLGQKVFSTSFSGEHLLMDTRHFPSGVYFVQLMSSGGLLTHKLVINH